MKSLTLLPLAFSLTTALPRATQRSTQCTISNSAMCGQQYSRVSWIGAHDSPFVGDLSDPRINQEVGVTGQLDAGIRFLEAQTHNDIFGTLSMCHTSCLLEDAGSVSDYLSKVKSWMDGNPGEVVTLLLANGDNVDVGDFDDAFTSSGLNKYAFAPSTSPNALDIDDWPTLQEMISDGKRLVVFLDYGADESKVDYILDEFKYFFDTPYDVTDANFNECSINSPPGASPDGRMYIVNHFLDKKVMDGVLVPNTGANSRTNAATGKGSIGAQVDLCTSKYGRPPNFVLLDMFDRGQWKTAQSAMNSYAQ